MPYLPRALHPLVPQVLCALGAIELQVPHALRPLCPMCSRALHASCHTCSRASCTLCPMCCRALCVLFPTCSRAKRALVPHVPRALCAPVIHVPHALCGIVCACLVLLSFHESRSSFSVCLPIVIFFGKFTKVKAKFDSNTLKWQSVFTNSMIYLNYLKPNTKTDTYETWNYFSTGEGEFKALYNTLRSRIAGGGSNKRGGPKFL